MATLAQHLKAKGIKLQDPLLEHNRRVQFIDQQVDQLQPEAESVASSSLASPVSSAGDSSFAATPTPTKKAKAEPSVMTSTT